MDNWPFPVPADGEATPIVDFWEWYDWFTATWEQGQHVTAIGTTGSGKTTLIKMLIGVMPWVTVVGVKARDDTMDEFIRAGYTRIRKWASADIDDYLVFWPSLKSLDDLNAHKRPYLDCLNGIYRSGGWCVFLDEVSFLSDMLGLEKPLKMLLNQGRSSGVTVVAATQRAAFIPLAFYDQASHLILWKDPDRRNRQRVAELTGDAMPVVMRELAQLSKREVIYINKDTGYRVRFTVEVNR